MFIFIHILLFIFINMLLFIFRPIHFKLPACLFGNKYDLSDLFLKTPRLFISTTCKNKAWKKNPTVNFGALFLAA